MKNPSSLAWFILGLVLLLVAHYVGVPDIVLLGLVLIMIILYSNLSFGWLAIAREAVSHKDYSKDNFDMLDYLRNAVKNNEFVLHYQPQKNIKSGKIVAAEALIRWNHPKLGLVYPDHFIGLAEHHDLITMLSLWVVRQALADLKKIQDLGYYNFTMAINMSPYCHITDELLSMFRSGFIEAKIKPEDVTFEITESVISMSHDHTMKMLKELDLLGVDLSIDDFGTGQSSLIYLKNLPISELKVDREFVTNLGDNDQDFYIVQSIVHLAKGLHCRSVAEGVETKTVYDLLEVMECELAQGYYISKPVPIDEFIRVLERK